MFRILVDGEEVYTEEQQVTRLSVMTSRGVAAEVGIADEGTVDIQLIRVAPGGVRRLDQVERERVEQDRERAKEGEPVGVAPSTAPRELNANQFGDSVNAPPTVDLASGLDSDDSDTLTARINAFGSHGDAQRAVDENQPGGGNTTDASADAAGTGIDTGGEATTPAPGGLDTDVRTDSAASAGVTAGVNTPAEDDFGNPDRP